MKALIPFIVLAACCMSCLYQMPDDETADTRPKTNNPNVVRQASDGNMPTVSY